MFQIHIVNIKTGRQEKFQLPIHLVKNETIPVSLFLNGEGEGEGKVKGTPKTKESKIKKIDRYLTNSPKQSLWFN